VRLWEREFDVGVVPFDGERIWFLRRRRGSKMSRRGSTRAIGCGRYARLIGEGMRGV